MLRICFTLCFSSHLTPVLLVPEFDQAGTHFRALLLRLVEHHFGLVVEHLALADVDEGILFVCIAFDNVNFS